MAKYNRDFLVPYLEDVCALYMCEEILLVRAFGVQKQIVVAEGGEKIDPPAYPNYEEKWTDGNIGGIFGSALFIIGAFFLMSLVPWDFITVICLGTIALFGWLLISTVRNIKRISDENTFREFRYNSEYAEYLKK